MTYRNLLLASHILLALLLVGPLAVAAVTAPARVRSRDLGAIHSTSRLEERLGRLSPPVLVTGVLLVLREDAFGFRQGWIAGALVLFVAAAVIGAVGVGGATRAAVAKVEAGQRVDAEMERLRVLGAVLLAIVAALVWLMVAKPGL